MKLTDEGITAHAHELGLALFASRKARETHPEGRSDGKRWYMAEHERCECCGDIRTPSAAFPWSQMVHARTRKHCLSLFSENKREQLPADALALVVALEKKLAAKTCNPSALLSVNP